MSVQENVQVVKDGYAAFSRRDIPGLLALLAEDVEWHIPGVGLPLAGTYRGPNGVASFFQKLALDVEILEFEPREFVAEGDRVLVVGWERAKVKATNRAFELDWVMAFTVRNGKITKFREYTDTQAVAAAYESTARAAGLN
jgi:ketosteroid isomerase-like protein